MKLKMKPISTLLLGAYIPAPVSKDLPIMQFTWLVGKRRDLA